MGITAVRLPAESMSRDAVEYLIDMIQGQKQVELMRKFPPILTERGSIVRPAQEKQGEKIVVVGSMNMDVTMEVSRVPVSGKQQKHRLLTGSLYSREARAATRRWEPANWEGRST